METTSNEVWRDIEGFEGKYQVSNLGRVRSLDRYVPAYCWKTGTIVDYFRRGRILKPNRINSGYLTVGLAAEPQQQRMFLIHRLVARAFVPGYKKGYDVNHKDENKHNNKASNLEWCDRSYNINYGESKWRRKKFNARKVEQLTLDNKHVAYYDTMLSASRTTGIDSASIGHCCHGTRKSGSKIKHCQTAGGFRWRFA